jgi:hypothetical protein
MDDSHDSMLSSSGRTSTEIDDLAAAQVKTIPYFECIKLICPFSYYATWLQQGKVQL